MSTNDLVEKLSNMSTLYQLARRNYEDALDKITAHQAALKVAADALEKIQSNDPEANRLHADELANAALAQLRALLAKPDGSNAAGVKP